MYLFYKISRGFVLALLFLYAGFAWAGTVEISEVAWMGTVPKAGESAQAAANNEWLELHNLSSSPISLEGWKITAEDGMPDFALSGVIPAGGYFLMERGSDDVVPAIAADFIYPFKNNALSNAGEHLFLKDAAGAAIDEINASSGWPAGDNTTKDTMQKISGVWQTLASTPKAPPPGASSAGSSFSASTSSSTPSSDSSQGGTSSSGGSAYIEEAGPRAVIYAVSSGIAGAGTTFDAAVYDAGDKEILPERYFWNFGDGAWAEGKKVIHTFRFPAKYQVSFSAKVGSRLAAAYREVEILPNKIFISEVKPGRDSWLELFNSSLKKLNIAGWILRSGTSTFLFQEESYVLPQTFLVVSEETSRLALSTEGQVELLYPNGSSADIFSYLGALDTGQSFQRGPRNLVEINIATPASGVQKYEGQNSGFGAVENPPPPAQVYNRESEVASQTAASASPETSPENQTALLPRFNFSGSFYSWALLSLGMGALAALGFIASRRL